MPGAVFGDFETRSTVDLRKCGADVYFEHSSTSIWCLCFTFDNSEEIEVWRPGDPVHHRLAAHIMEGGAFIAHNAAFELLCYKALMEPLGWPELHPEQVDCTMARAAALSLPQGLDQLCEAMRLSVQKDREGHRIMLQLCKPRRWEDGEPTWWDDPGKIDRLIEYCKNDVRAEREVWRRLHPLTKAEKKLWQLDYAINRRGVQLDLPNIAHAQKLVADASHRADAELAQATGWHANSTRQVGALMEWLDAAGVDLENLRKRTVADALKRGVADDTARRVLELRQLASKASTAKLVSMEKAASKDGRARGLQRYHNSSTGRFGSVRVNLYNMPRCTFTDPSFIPLTIDQFALSADAVRLYGGPVMEAVASCLRGMIISREGYDLVGGDYSNIEGRICAWLAGEKWKLDAFRSYDAGTGPDLYKIRAAAILRIAIKLLTDKQRQAFGKVPELALQYQGGLGAFSSMALNYDITVVPGFKDDLENYILSENTVRDIVAAWREAHPKIISMWAELQKVAIKAIWQPDKLHQALGGKVAYRKSGPYLWCILPSGRTICYARPRVERATGENAWKGLQIVYEGIDQKTKKWTRQEAYGGMLAENCLSGNSVILTDKGRIRLKNLTHQHRVWDGKSFVFHGGLLYKGFQTTIGVNGVSMTPDHLVLTTRGWRYASQSEGLDRAAAWLPRNSGIPWLGREKISLSRPLRLRKYQDHRRQRVSKRPYTLLRVHDETLAQRSQNDARFYPASRLRSMAVNAGPLPLTLASRVEKLRRPRDNGMRRMAKLRGVLARYGTLLPRRTDVRAQRRKRSVLKSELHMGLLPRSSSKPAQFSACGCSYPIPALRHTKKHALLSPETRRFRLTRKAGRSEQVYDILNCGPLNRFAVLGEDGLLLVHNCTQAVARDCLVAGIYNVEAASYPTVLHVYDEAVTEVPEGFGSVDEFGRLMTKMPPWACGLPLSVKAWRQKRYGLK